jgi:ketosteroid isomerase-like protein
MHTINDVLENYQRSVLEQNVDNFISMYDDNVHLFDSWSKWNIVGKTVWQTHVEDWFSVLKRDNSTLRVSYEDLTIYEADNLASIHVNIRFSEYNSNKIEFRHLTNRFTFILKKIDASWKIVHEHSSLPINPDDGKGIFDLK